MLGVSQVSKNSYSASVKGHYLGCFKTLAIANEQSLLFRAKLLSKEELMDQRDLKHVSVSNRKRIIELFYDLDDNSSKAISKIIDVPSTAIDYVLDKYIKKKTERINQRDYKDIDWGDL